MIMDLKKKIKAFFTFDRRANDGFTLVELIVVIAILAILGGVAVPAYSGYVTKANMQADITLVSEIEHALTLGGYSGTIKEGEAGYVTLTTAGVTVHGANADVAMKAVFGDGYADTLKLKYANWGNNGMLASLLSGANPKETAQNIMTSPYITGNSADQLLEEVENLTTVASGILSAFIGSANGDSVAAYNMAEGLFKDPDVNSTNNAFTAAFKEVYGENGDKSKLTETEIANLLVMAAAKEFSGGQVVSGGGDMVGQYAMLVAFASTEAGKADPNVVNAYKTLQNAIKDGENVEGSHTEYVINAMNDCMAAMGECEAFGTWYSGAGLESSMQAFADIMSAVDSADVKVEDLKNTTLFTAGKGSELFNTYLTNAELISGMTADEIEALKTNAAGAGNVVVSYNFKGAAINIVNSAISE